MTSTADEEGSLAVIEGPSSPSSRHVFGLDSLRFVLASWVVLDHFGISPIRDLLIGLNASRTVRGISDSIFNGGAAVMVFFIISGFCIHLPFTRPGAKITLRYFVRREVRILPPVLVMCVLGWLTHNFAFLTVIWSLVCEEIYYLLYPLFRKQIRPDKCRVFVSACIAAALLTIPFRRDTSVMLSEQGISLTWLLFSPLWILGAFLAEAYSHGTRLLPRIPLANARGIWVWRLGMLTLSVIQDVLLVVRPLGRLSMLTFLAFGLISVLWLDQEIHYYERRSANRWFEMLGKGSYSLYLSHPFILQCALAALVRSPIYQNPLYQHFLPSAIWFPGIAGVIVFAVLIYYLVERPSHQLARRLGSAKAAG